MTPLPIPVTPSAEAKAKAWAPPQGHADVAPSRYERIEGDGYLTLDAPWVVPALLGAVAVEGPVLEPAAGRGHLSRELIRAGLDVTSFDVRQYADPLVPDIGIGDIRALTSLAGFAWTITNLPYADLEALATRLIGLGARDGCATALLVRAEWIVPKARRRLVRDHPRFAGVVMLTKRPRWVDRGEARAAPRRSLAALRRLGSRDARGAAMTSQRSFKITNPRRLGKNTLVGAFDLEMPSGLKINGVMLFEKNSKRWINFPSKEWVKPDGTKSYSPLLEFASRDVADHFQALVLPLAEEALEVD